MAARRKSPFAKGEYVVYPAHGVGRVMGQETHEVAGEKVRLITVRFEHDRMVLRVPAARAEASGLRPVSAPAEMDAALKVLRGKSRVRRLMWSRRAQEYEAKTNSGDPIRVAEVVRDLYRGRGQPEQSYSERQLYQAALTRLAREVAVVGKTDEDAAIARLEDILAKSSSARARSDAASRAANGDGAATTASDADGAPPDS